MQLQESFVDLQKKGLGLAAISYDSPETLLGFASQRSITYPLLSDVGSAVIRRYGILNAEATGRAAGVPYPGTFLIDTRGTVIDRSFEEAYQERTTAASLTARAGQPLLRPGAGTRKAETPHLTLTTAASDSSASPGTRLSLFVDIVPKPRMHVYAPGQKDYIPISLSLASDEAFKAHAPVFPKAEKYYFEPLKETQLVYSKPLRIVQDVTLALTPDLRERARTAGGALTIRGTLRYQACDDKVCYMPQTLPVEWTVRLKPLER